MFVTVFEYVLRAVSYVWNLFFTLADHFNFLGLITSIYVAFTVCRFLIWPLIGQAGSDNATFVLDKLKGDKSTPKNTRVKGQIAIESKSRVGKSKR